MVTLHMTPGTVFCRSELKSVASKLFSFFVIFRNLPLKKKIGKFVIVNILKSALYIGLQIYQ